MRWAVMSTVGWMVGLVGAIGLVVVVGSIGAVVATAIPVVSEGCSVVVGTDMVGHCDMAGSGIAGCSGSDASTVSPFLCLFHLCMDWTLCVASWGMVV